MSSKDLRWIRSYFLAILTVCLALQAFWVIQPYLSTEPPFITFLAAIMVTAWYGGFRPALFATLLSAGLIDYYLLDPVQSFHTTPPDIGSLVFFGMVATTMGYAIAHLQRARQVAVTIQKQAVMIQKQVEHLHELSGQLLNEETLERMLQRVLTAVLDLLGAHKGVIRLYDPEKHTLALTTQVGFKQEEHSTQFQHVSVDSSSCGTVIDSKERVMIDNIATDARCSHLVALPAMSDVVSAHSMPLFRADRSVFGVLTTYDTRPSIPSEGDLRLVDLYTRQAERVLEAKDNEERLRQANAEKEAVLASLVSEMSILEKTERRDLAAELHDYLAQLLVLAQIKLRLAQRSMSPASEKSAGYIQEAVEVITLSQEYARTVMAELYPPALYTSGLPAAVQWLGGQMSKHGLSVELSITCDAVTFPEDGTELLYKSIRELLMNVVKHAGVDWAKVSMQVDAGNILVISVQDWGQGFNTSLATGNGTCPRFGLMHIHERMRMMGGWCQVHSTVGHGTTITLGLPQHLQSGSDALRARRAPQPDRVKARPTEFPPQEGLPWDTR